LIPNKSALTAEILDVKEENVSLTKEELEMRTRNIGNEWLIAHLNFIRGPE